LVDDGVFTVSSPGVVSGFAVFDGDLYFSGIAQGNAGPDLYKLDALGDLTSIPLRTGPNAAFGSFAGEDGGFAAFNGGMFFNAFTDAVGSDALFRLDSNGTVTVVRDGSNNVLFHTSGETSNFEQFDGNLYFTEQGPSTFADLYRMDAQGNVTAITVADNGTALDNPGGTGYAQFNGNLYFAATNPSSGSAELFALSPGSNTATLVLDAQSNVLSNAGIDGGFTVFDGILYFNAFDSGLGEDMLYRLAPNGAPTPVLDGQGHEIAHIFGDGTNFTQFDGALYFTALTSDGEELVKLDAAGQVTVTDINPGPSSSSPGASGGFTMFPGASLTGTAGNDIIVGSPNGHNLISGLAGDDLIFAYSGDIVSGGAGTDTLVMGSTGAIDLTGVTGVEIIALSSGASNQVTLTNGNFGPSTMRPAPPRKGPATAMRRATRAQSQCGRHLDRPQRQRHLRDI
jgi:ELWxxDGT repeat protein